MSTVRTCRSSYIDHVRSNNYQVVEPHSWEEDCDARLTWLYGSAVARKWTNHSDLEAWNHLGERVAP